MAKFTLRSDLPALLSRLGFQPGLLLRSDLYKYSINRGKMAKINSNKDTPSHSQRSVLLKYLIILGKRIYRPMKPIINPLLKKIKLSHVLGGLVIVGIGGSFWFTGSRYQAQERAAWWPWSTKAHSQMALAWFENGNEEKALEELILANKLLTIKTFQAKTSLKKAEEAVTRPEKVRQEIESWEKILGGKPSYRDVLLRLSLLNYQIYENEKAKSYWEKANYLDPNSEKVQEVGEIIFFLP